MSYSANLDFQFSVGVLEFFESVDVLLTKLSSVREIVLYDPLGIYRLAEVLLEAFDVCKVTDLDLLKALYTLLTVGEDLRGA